MPEIELSLSVNPASSPLSLRPVPCTLVMVLPVIVVGVASLLRMPVEPPETVFPVIVAPVDPADTSMPGPLAGRTVLASMTVSLAWPTTMIPP